MPIEHRNYRMSENGQLIWRWEQAFYNKKGDQKMPFKKKYKCFFCKKDISEKQYPVIDGTQKWLTCSFCSYISKIFIRERESGRTRAIKKILESVIPNKRHCTTCVHFKSISPSICRRHNYTGVGTHQDEYPNSYARCGCEWFASVYL